MKTNKDYQRTFKEKMRGRGLVQFTCWIKPEWKQHLLNLLKRLENKDE